MSARVRIEDGRDGFVVYRRYQVRRYVKTGTRDRAEAEAMAEDLDASLVAEQRKKMAERADWRPAGLEAPRAEPKPTPASAPFNAPPLVR